MGAERSRIERGRSYVRNRRVEELSIEPGLISARVQGTRPVPYRVDVRLPVLEDALWRDVVVALAAQAGTIAAMLAGELPEAAEEALGAVGQSLFPTAERAAFSCSCPDWEKPCKHAMAVLLLVADRLATDPFVLFALRGRTRDDLLAAVRSVRSADAVEPDEASLGPSLRDALAGGLDHFWSSPAALAEPTESSSPPALRRLPPPPAALGGAMLRQELATAYATLAHRARELLD